MSLLVSQPDASFNNERKEKCPSSTDLLSSIVYLDRHGLAAAEGIKGIDNRNGRSSHRKVKVLVR